MILRVKPMKCGQKIIKKQTFCTKERGAKKKSNAEHWMDACICLRENEIGRTAKLHAVRPISFKNPPCRGAQL